MGKPQIKRDLRVDRYLRDLKDTSIPSNKTKTNKKYS